MPLNYSFDRRKSGPARRGGKQKLSWAEVKDIRLWASREGFGLTKAEQIRRLQQSFYGFGLSAPSLREILNNDTWHDESYVPGQPHESLGELTMAQLMIQTLRRTA